MLHMLLVAMVTSLGGLVILFVVLCWPLLTSKTKCNEY